MYAMCPGVVFGLLMGQGTCQAAVAPLQRSTPCCARSSFPLSLQRGRGLAGPQFGIPPFLRRPSSESLLCALRVSVIFALNMLQRSAHHSRVTLYKEARCAGSLLKVAGPRGGSQSFSPYHLITAPSLFTQRIISLRARAAQKPGWVGSLCLSWHRGISSINIFYSKTSSQVCASFTFTFRPD